MDDYTKVTYGMRDTLQLIRKDDNDALFRTAAGGAGKVVLSELAWVVPIVQPNDVAQSKSVHEYCRKQHPPCWVPEASM